MLNEYMGCIESSSYQCWRRFYKEISTNLYFLNLSLYKYKIRILKISFEFKSQMNIKSQTALHWHTMSYYSPRSSPANLINLNSACETRGCARTFSCSSCNLFYLVCCLLFSTQLSFNAFLMHQTPKSGQIASLSVTLKELFWHRLMKVFGQGTGRLLIFVLVSTI